MGGLFSKFPRASSHPTPSQGQVPESYRPAQLITGLLSRFSRASSNPMPSQIQVPERYGPAHPITRPSAKYSFIPDMYDSLEQVTEALRAAGLESSNLIVGIDFTKSNEWTGKHSFNGQSLHMISSNTPNPYEQVFSIIGKTLSAFDEDNLIPCFGFGDVSTHDHSVFSFYPDGRSCAGFEEGLARYKEIVPHLSLAGPTSFAPIIEAAIDIVEQSGGQFHVLVIIADGQVTRSIDMGPGRLSPQEQNTIDAIVAASEFALSIVLVGVGDGPFDMMKQFDDNIPRHTFDNFQFVNFTQIVSKNMATPQKEAAFALAALMEIPTQFKATMELGFLNRRKGKMASRVVLPPPQGVLQYDRSIGNIGNVATEAEDTQQNCLVCLTQPKDMAFGCGHQTCKDCGKDLVTCPLCRQAITTRLRLY